MVISNAITIKLADFLSRGKVPGWFSDCLDKGCGFAVSLAESTLNGGAKFITKVIQNMDAQRQAVKIVAGIKKAGIDFVATLPDEKMVEVICAVAKDPGLKHVPLCREEEGIGICAGAHLAGKKTALIMQNAGFLNSCNALTTTSLQFQIPVLLLIYYAGDMGDRGFTTLGSVTEPALQALGIRYAILRNQDAIDETLCDAQILAEDSKKPVAVLLTKNVLGVK